MPNAINIKFGPRAKSAAVSEYSRVILSDIMKAAKEADCLITSTQRSPADQARAMYDNIVFYGVPSQLALYGPNGQAVVRKYEELKKLGKNAEQIQAGMTQKIIELGPDKVSRHCADPLKVNVFDIDPNSVGNRQAFEQAVKLDKRVSKFLQPPEDPAYHLEIPQHTQQTGPTIAAAAPATAAVERLELTKEQLKKIADNRHVFDSAQAHTGVPWQAVAAIWTRESFSVAPPKRPGGQFQFDPVPTKQQLTSLLR
ncbi:MAG: hypothetical protein HC888_05980 [Candidatus Competibacteraceae bacterium]|nr:hypothetical protein [Candidatus Competibacteraceae bacterium]